MICQEKLISKIDNFKSLPHSILLLGEAGSGQKEVCKYISEKYKLYFIDLDNITKELVDQMYLSSEQSLYAIDITTLDEKKQNILLKIFEEPSSYSYIILYGESVFNLLDTIINRSYVLRMERFSFEYLSSISKDQRCLAWCSTPGQIEIANHTDIDKLLSLCSIFLSRLSEADFYNALTIANKINFDDQYDKFDLRLFIKVLGSTMVSSGEYKLLQILHDLNTNIWYMNDKRRYFQHFIIEAWKLERGIK